MGNFRKFVLPFLTTRVLSAQLQISTQRPLIKNCLDDSKIIAPTTPHAKFQTSAMIRLGCKEGCVRKSGCIFTI